jgi:CMP-N,N'-diacetyllegionaminic acid synthase
MKPRVLGLIPAKGGSQRLSKKNIRKLQGRPLIAWAGDAARRSGVIDRLVLSTESEEVAEAARKSGIEVPFMRPAYLAENPYGVVDVALHALDALETEGDRFDRLVILLPTAPLRTGDDIQDAYALFDQKNGKFLMSVSEYPHTPFTAMLIDGDDELQPCFPEHLEYQSQALPKAYCANGAIHILDVVAFRKAKDYYAKPLIPYVMPIEKSADIDTENDFQWVEFLLRKARGDL